MLRRTPHFIRTRHTIQQRSHRDLLEKSCSSTVDQRSVLDYGDIRYLWKVRFVPKTASVRYLACAQEEFNGKEGIDHLRYSNEVLKYLRRHNAHLMGIAAFNRAEMHRRWQDYCQLAPNAADGGMVYFLVGEKVAVNFISINAFSLLLL